MARLFRLPCVDEHLETDSPVSWPLDSVSTGPVGVHREIEPGSLNSSGRKLEAVVQNVFDIAHWGRVVHHVDVVLNTVCISFAEDWFFSEFPFHPESREGVWKVTLRRPVTMRLLCADKGFDSNLPSASTPR